MFHKHRLEALSDGIFAITMTLLVLEFKVPEHVDHGQLWAVLQQQRVAFACYVLTFGITARYWILQHRVFDVVENIRQPAVVLTFFFLSMVTLLPFTTPLLARYGADHTALAIYCVNQAAIGIALVAKLEWVRVQDPFPKTAELRSLRWKLWTLTLAMAMGGVTALFTRPLFAFAVPALMLIASRRFYRMPAPSQAHGLSANVNG